MGVVLGVKPQSVCGTLQPYHKSVHLDIQGNEVLEELDVMLGKLLDRLALVVAVFQHLDLTYQDRTFFQHFHYLEFLNTCIR